MNQSQDRYLLKMHIYSTQDSTMDQFILNKLKEVPKIILLRITVNMICEMISTTIKPTNFILDGFRIA